MTEYRYEGKGILVGVDERTLAMCWEGGAEARRRSRERGDRDHRHGPANEALLVSIQAWGYIGEAVASRALGIPSYAPDVDAFKDRPDVPLSPHREEARRIGYGVGVRAVSVPSYGMWIRRRDPDGVDMVLVLLHGIPDRRPSPNGRYRPGVAEVVGWYPTTEARLHNEWLNDFKTGGAEELVVPQSELLDIRVLRADVHERMRAAGLVPLPDLPIMDVRPRPSPPEGGRRAPSADGREERRQQELARFRAEQHNRMAFIHAGLDERQPPEYRGRAFDMGTNQGVAYFGTPPYRDDPQGPLTEEFIAFQEYDGHRIRREHPEYYCTECAMRFASGRCPSCKSGRVVERESVGEDGLIGMECKSCGARFRGEAVCGPCLSTRPEVIKEMAEEKARKQRTRGRGGSVVPDPILYPD